MNASEVEPVRAELGQHVRVWDGPHNTVRAEGTIVGVILVPTLIVRDSEGVRHYEASSLPRELL